MHSVQTCFLVAVVVLAVVVVVFGMEDMFARHFLSEKVQM